MSDTVEKKAVFRDLFGNISAFSHDKTEIELKKINVHLLEMEDVLFHHDSAVMMPDGPSSSSSSKSQMKVTGVKAVALIFKELEFDPDKRIVVTGHADTSGKDSYNYALSKKRALNVLYLMVGERDKWVDISHGHHKVEDYQQMMIYFARTRGWKCSPWKADNKFGTKTDKAVTAFVKDYNAKFVGTHKDKDGNDFDAIPANTPAQVNADGNHKWPKVMWKAAFNIYTQDICDALSTTPAGLALLQAEDKLQFVDPKKPYVACGESFPIKDADKDGHRSQDNRRVEILMFDKDETPALDCPVDTDKKHKEEDCPLWHGWHFAPIYIMPGDLNSVVYHMSFRYYNYVLKKFVDVPEGLQIQAFERRKILKNKVLDTVTEYRKKGENGIYHVKVRFDGPLDKKKACEIYFEFSTKGKKDTKNKYVFTKNDKSDPRILSETASEVTKKPFRDRCHYYDLPERWSSRYSWTRYDGDMTKSDMFFKVIKDLKKYKPWGTTVPKPGEPLIFCLDDLILTDNNLVPIKQPVAKYEYAVLDHELAVHDPDNANNKPYYTKDGHEIKAGFQFVRVPLPNKRLGGVVMKHRNDNIYKLFGVFSDRVPSSHMMTGHRAAVYDHKTMGIRIPNFNMKHRRDSGATWTTGNFHAYLLRDQDLNDKGEEVSYIFAYFPFHFKRCAGTADCTCSVGAGAWPISNANWPPWINTAITSLTNEWNHDAAKELVSLYYKKDKAIYRINIRYHIEQVPLADCITRVNVHKPSGGRSDMGLTVGNIKSTEHVRDGANQITAAHEFGHALGLDDEYAENGNFCSYTLAGVVDFKEGSPFLMDETAMMKGSQHIRSRYYWQYAEWMYEEFKKPSKLKFEVHRKNDPIYKLPHDTSSDWDPRLNTKYCKNYVNFAAKIQRNDANSVSTLGYKGKFHAYLYPLGSDGYTDGVMRTGQQFTAVVVLNVNVYVSAWSGNPNVAKVYQWLDRFKTDVKAQFQDSQGVKIVGDDPYQDTFVLVQPRFLVGHYATDYQARLGQTQVQFTASRNAALATTEGATKHLSVKISNAASSIDLTTNPIEVNLKNNNAGRNNFWKYFSHALGLGYGLKLRKTKFGIGTFVPNGTVEDL